MQVEIDNNKIVEKLENEIIMNAIHKCRDPLCFNYRYAGYITCGKIETLLEFNIIDEETANKYIKLAKGFYDNEIYQDYLDAIASEAISIEKYLKTN